MEPISLSEFLENFTDYKQKYLGQFVFRSSKFHSDFCTIFLREEKFLDAINTGIEIDRFGSILNVIVRINELFGNDVRICVEEDKICINLKRGDERYTVSSFKNGVINMQVSHNENKLLILLLEAQHEFKSLLECRIEVEMVEFVIYPFVNITNYFYKVHSINDLKIVKLLSDKLKIKICGNYKEEKLIEKNPHLKEILKWDNFIIDDLLYSSKMYSPPYSKTGNRADCCGIKKAEIKIINYNLHHIEKGNFKFDFLNTFSIREFIRLINYDIKPLREADKDDFERYEKYSSRTYKYLDLHQDSIDALTEGTDIEDFNGNLGDLKTILGLD